MAGICRKPRRASPIGRAPGGVASWSVSPCIRVIAPRLARDNPRVAEFRINEAPHLRFPALKAWGQLLGERASARFLCSWRLPLALRTTPATPRAVLLEPAWHPDAFSDRGE